MRKDGKSWQDAIQDGWVPGKNLFDVDEAISRGTIVMNLLSDAAQSETWPAIKPQLTKGKVRQRVRAQRWRLFFGELTGRPDPLLLARFLPRLQGPHQGRRAQGH